MFVGNIFDGDTGVDTGDIPASLRFRRAASANITTGVTTATTSTYFCFFKQGALDAVNPIFDGNIKINANNTITAFGLTTSAVKRDPTSPHWIHVSNNGLVFDGVNLGAVTTSAITNLRIGYDGTNYADMYGSRMCCVSGTSLPYTDFVYFNSTINEWVVKSQGTIKALVDAGGAASFMYDFDNATSLTTLGHDKSSKGNNATLNNFSITVGTAYDHMLDVPGNSFANWNPLPAYAFSPVLSEGNLFSSPATGAAAGDNLIGSLGFTSGKISWEAQCTQLATPGGYLAYIGMSTTGIPNDTSYIFYLSDGTKTVGGAISAYGASYTTSNIITVDVDMEAQTVTFYKDNVSQGAISFSSSLVFPACRNIRSTTTSTQYRINCGQRPRTYANHTGFLNLCQRNLPDPAILNPKEHHNVYTVTKSGDTNFTLDWDGSVYDTFFEIKRRNGVGDWYQVDGLRGYDKILKSNSTAAETTDANVIGVSGTTCTLKSTLTDGTYVIKAYKAGLTASRQTNTDGSITSTVSRNVTSGFAIVTCTGTAANATVGHGLGKAPKHIVAKATAAITEWPVYNSNIANTEYLVLNTTAAKATGATYWNSATASSTVFSLGSSTNTNNSGGMVFYVHAEIAGYSKAFTHTGNASADGVYVDCGFKWKSSTFKCSSTTGNWTSLDTIRNTSNVMGEQVYPNLTNAESTVTTMDATALGYKMRLTTDPNSAQTFVGIAHADVTGKYSLGR